MSKQATQFLFLPLPPADKCERDLKNWLDKFIQDKVTEALRLQQETGMPVRFVVRESKT